MICADIENVILDQLHIFPFAVLLSQGTKNEAVVFLASAVLRQDHSFQSTAEIGSLALCLT